MDPRKNEQDLTEWRTQLLKEAVLNLYSSLNVITTIKSGRMK
jgi:hypothetical protein